MALRIPQDFIDQLLNRIDIVDLIDSYVPLKKAGANYKACCPFHNEKTPSFTVSATKQFYHCFGCGASGSAISFLMEYDHMEFREAIAKLASQAGMEIPRESTPIKKQHINKNNVDLFALMDKVNQFYQQQLRQHADKQSAVDYLRQRGLSGAIAKQFELGFAPQGWDNLQKNIANNEAEQKALLDTGMLTKNDNGRVYDRFRERIMFPIRDHRGRIVGFGGRILTPQDNTPKYLNSPETPIFHKGSELYNLYNARGAIKQANGVLVVEGYMDVVALAQAGIDNAVATLGTATTPMHLQRLFRQTSNITFCFDGDRAGKAAAWKASETALALLQDGFQVSFSFLPDGEDPDSMVNKIGKQAFIELLQNAKPLPDFLIDHLQQQADIKRLDGRAKLTKLAEPLIKQLPNGILKKLIVERLARLTQIAPQDLLGKPAVSKQYAKQTPQRSRKSNGTSSLTPVRRAISLLLQQPQLANHIELDDELKNLDLRGAPLLIELIEYCQQNPSSTAILLEKHRQQSHYDALKTLAQYEHYLSDEQTKSALEALINKLKAQASDCQLEQLLEKSKHQSLNSQEKALLTELLSKSR